MQAWSNVKVINKDSDHFGRAGVVQTDGGNETSTVKLDASTTQAEEVVHFQDVELQLL